MKKKKGFMCQEIELVCVREHHFPYNSKVCNSNMAVRLFKKFLRGADREKVVGIYLDAANNVVAIQTISIGSLTAAILHPREVFKPIFVSNAAGLILAHNHPSGNPDPSEEDIMVARKLKSAADLLEVKLLDFLVLGGKGRFTSLIGRTQ